MGVILIIIYYIYNNLIWVGRVTHFLCGKCGKCGKCYPSAFCRICPERVRIKWWACRDDMFESIILMAL